MPIIKSAKKRVKVAAKQSIQNAKTKKAMRTAIKDFQTAIAAGASDTKVDESQKQVQSTIDIAVKKNVISKSRAARLTSRTNTKAKEANGGKRPKTTAKTSTKKAPTKKTVSKKPTAKKTATKKSTTTTKK